MNLHDTQVAQICSTFVNVNVDTSKHDPVSVNDFKLVHIKPRVEEKKPVKGQPEDWKALMAEMQAFTAALQKRGEVVRKKV
jgi:hypothetical protein